MKTELFEKEEDEVDGFNAKFSDNFKVNLDAGFKYEKAPFFNADIFKNLKAETTDVFKNFPVDKNDYFGVRPRANVTEADLYEDNGGTTIMIVVDNKIIIGADTRLNAEYNIYTRKSPKIFQIGKFHLTIAGFFADGYNIFLKLMYELNQYQQYAEMSLSSMARFLHHILYNRRFFPLYSYCCIGGYGNGKATIYDFDCVGSYQSTKCRVNGSGQSMIQPLLDSWIDGKNFNNYKGIEFEDAVKLIKKAFDSAAEADVKTGDHLHLVVVGESGPKEEFMDLRKD